MTRGAYASLRHIPRPVKATRPDTDRDSLNALTMKRVFILISIGLISLISLTCFADELININTASLEELDSLPGIGDDKAQAIIDYRNINGDFLVIEDIMNVSGIKSGTFNKIKDYITVGEIETEENEENKEEQEIQETQETGGGSSSNIQTNLSNDELEKIISKIIINEVMINPIGIDDEYAEWIELKNTAYSNFWVMDWKLKDNLGNEYLITKKFEPREILVLHGSSTGLVLNNLFGNLELVNSLGDRMDWVEWDEAEENISYGKCENEFIELENSTAGSENICEQENEFPVAYFEMSAEEVKVGEIVKFNASESYDTDGEIKIYNWEIKNISENNQFSMINFQFKEDKNVQLIKQSEDNRNLEIEFLNAGEYEIKLIVQDDKGDEEEFVREVKVNEKLKIKNEKLDDEKNIESNKIIKKQSNNLNISDVKNLAVGSLVKISGQVSVEPGVLGSQIFYISDENSGIQIYSFYKDFPVLAEGDFVEISGELTEAYGQKRIKIKSKENIYVVESGIIEPIDFNEQVGTLVKINGEVVQKSGNNFWVAMDEDEVQIQIKPTTGINLSNINEGDFVNLIGIVSLSGDEKIILPRYQSDVGIEKVLGDANKRELDANSSNNNWWIKYLVAIGVIGIIAVILNRLAKKTKV